MPKVFISYRREDSQYITDRIYDHLARAFPPEDIFRDVDSIAAGLDFRRTLEDAVGKCDLMLVVIGPKWTTVADGQGRRRLEGTNDFVRIEVEAALRRGVPVIPVTVDRASIPTEADLPATMRDLSFRNGRQVRPDPDFKNDIARLVRDIQAAGGAGRAAEPAPAARSAQAPSAPSPQPPPPRPQAPATPPVPAPPPAAMGPGIAAPAAGAPRAPGGRSGMAKALALTAGAAVAAAGTALFLARSSPAPEAAPRTNPAGIEWVAIPGGSLNMGSEGGGSDEKPVHRVTVPTFELARTEATVAQYKACVDAGVCSAPGTGGYCNWGVAGREQHPVNCVDWDQAKRFAEWAGGRLASEAEWEYSARSAGKGREYPWGDEEASCARAIILGCGGTTVPCSKPAGNTEQGLCDMAGNVSEWVEDRYHGSYDGAPSGGSAWVDAGSHRVFRGGSWRSDARRLRAAFRFVVGPGIRSGYLGLRPARSR